MTDAELASIRRRAERIACDWKDNAEEDRDALLAEVDRLRAALAQIRDTEGLVCGQYEICQHKACASSHRAWEIADAALKGVDDGHLRAVIAAAHRCGQEDMRERCLAYSRSDRLIIRDIEALPIRDLPEELCRST